MMSLFLLLVIGTGEVCAANPLDAARFTMSYGRWPDGWPTENAAKWFASEPSRGHWVRVAACESLNENVAVIWDEKGNGLTTANVHGVLTHSWGYQQRLLTRWGSRTELFNQLERARGIP